MVDIDALFETYFRKYIQDNIGKFSEEELENKVGEVYEQFGKTPLSELNGKSPVEFFANMDAKELVETLNDCINGGIPVSDYLCDAIEKSPQTAKYLEDNLNADTNEELAVYSLNLLNIIGYADRGMLGGLVQLLSGGEIGDSLKEVITETLVSHADEVKDEILKCYDEDDFNKNFFIEVLAATTPPDDRVFNVLIDHFNKSTDMTLSCSYISKYGDERAIPILKNACALANNYLDYKEIKLALEALGGEVDEERDFTSDPIYRKLKYRS